MPINLDFTKDKNWIENRENLWEKKKIGYESELSKKQVEIHKQYFLTGIPPKNREDIHQTAYVDLFPLQTKEGLEYCFKEYFNPTIGCLRDDWLSRFWKYYEDKSEEVGCSEALKLFTLFCGDKYLPIINFPFRIFNEKEYRQFSIDPKDILYVFIKKINWCLKNSEEDNHDLIYIELIDYMFSIFHFIPQNKMYFVIPSSPSAKLPYEESQDINDTINWCKRMHEFLKLFVNKSISVSTEEIRQKKLAYIEKVCHRFDNIKSPEYPQSLIDHWQWVKSGGKIRYTPPPKI